MISGSAICLSMGAPAISAMAQNAPEMPTNFPCENYTIGSFYSGPEFGEVITEAYGALVKIEAPIPEWEWEQRREPAYLAKSSRPEILFQSGAHAAALLAYEIRAGQLWTRGHRNAAIRDLRTAVQQAEDAGMPRGPDYQRVRNTLTEYEAAPTRSDTGRTPDQSEKKTYWTISPCQNEDWSRWIERQETAPVRITPLIERAMGYHLEDTDGLLGVIREGRTAELEADLKAAVAANRDMAFTDTLSADPYALVLADLYRATDRRTEAIGLLLDELALRAGNPVEAADFNRDYGERLARLYVEAGELELAERYARLAEAGAVPIETDRSSAGVNARLPLELTRGDFAAAEEAIYDNFVEGFDAGPNGWLAIASLQRRQGHPDLADAVLSWLRDVRLVDETEGPYQPDLAARTHYAGALVRRDQRRNAEALAIVQRLAEAPDAGERDANFAVALNQLLVELLIAEGKHGAELAAATRQLDEAMRSDRTQVSIFDSSLQTAEFDSSSEGERQLLLAGAYWLTSQGGDPQATSAAFEWLQRAMVNPASASIAQMAVRRIAEAQGGELAGLVEERERMVAVRDLAIAALNEALAAPADDPAANARLISARQDASRRIAEIEARLRAEIPAYLALVEPTPVGLEETRQLLAPNQSLLLLMPTADGTHAFGIGLGGIAWHRSSWSETQIGTAVDRLRWDVGATTEATAAQLDRWENELREGEPFPFDRGTAHALYAELVAPVERVLQPEGQLFVIAGGKLASLPFSMLVTARPEGLDNDPEALRSTRWLADIYALAHLPSVQSLKLLKLAKGEAALASDRTSFAGFGDPILEGQAQTRGLRGASYVGAGEVLSWRPGAGETRLADVDSLRKLARLPGTARELENMRRTLNADENSVRIASAATESAVRSADLSDTRVVAFATHGLMPGEAKALVEPGLVFTPPAIASTADDGFLSASEVAGLRLHADWVILSACNTATGENGAGLSSLARSFFFAGARNLLASHWPVNDDVASFVTVRTFEILQERPQLSRAAAFQHAIRETRLDSSHDTAEHSWAHPAFWAPFVLIGGG
ncbi:CHAT domain-containing protein [Qipengyuania flava]|uniref:CHAT domain-containing protein n=1 Tax=Qipengyuania flava TaxID=192812 RepID=UPI001C639469|nr:CHAT domain-containing protein [Qipengyuania flava]QYJ07044.1 CHAT domain-containing protein [Qipengyuania flava]